MRMCLHDNVCAVTAGFGHLAKDMEKNSDEWFNWCNNDSREHTNMPGDWARMSEFKQLLLLRALRPDRVAAALQRFCESAMGARYVNQEAFSAQAVLAESSRWVVACANKQRHIAARAVLCHQAGTHVSAFSGTCSVIVCNRWLAVVKLCRCTAGCMSMLISCLCVYVVPAVPRQSSSSCSLATPRPRTSRSMHASWARPLRVGTSH
jgi:hypothetical protein